MGLFSQGLGAVALVVASLIPDIARTLRLQPEVAIPTLASVMVCFVAAMIACRRDGGPLGRAHRTVELAETWVTALTGAAFVHAAGTALCIWWFIPVVQILANLPFQGFGHRQTFGAITTLNVLVIAGFAVNDQLSDALMSTVFVGVLMLLMTTIGRWSNSFVEAEATRRVAERELSAARVQSERHRIARDLHDGLGAELSSLIWRARSLGQGEQSVIPDLEAEVVRLIGRLRHYVSGLESTDTELSELGEELKARLNNQCGNRVALELTCRGGGIVNAAAAEALCRCADEAVRNAMQHGGAARIEVLLQHDTHGSSLIVRDDGRGLGDSETTDGRGMANMRERAAECGGTVEFVPAALGGAEVCIRIPREP